MYIYNVYTSSFLHISRYHYNTGILSYKKLYNSSILSCKPHPTKVYIVSHPHAKQVFMCNYVTGSAGMTCRDIGADKQYYVVLIVAHAVLHVAVTCEKDVGMGLCRLTLCLGYPYTLFACFLALHPYIFLNFLVIFFIDL